MFSGYKIKVIHREEVLFLYLNESYEFGIFDSVRKRTKNMMESINEYMKDYKIDFHGKRIFLVANGVLISTLLVNPLDYNFRTLQGREIPDFELTSVLISDSKKEVEMGIEPTDASLESNIEEDLLSITNSSMYDEEKSSLKQEEDKKMELPKELKEEKEENQKETSFLLKDSFEEIERKDPYETGIGEKIIIERSNGMIVELALEDYVIGVVAGEMPATFEGEALKAQAVASRTYLLQRIQKNSFLSDTVKDQLYIDVFQMQKKWGSEFDKFYQKIKSAVLSTRGECIYYNGNLIDAVYFSTSNGYTEDAEYVWGSSFPYLKSVESKWDQNASTYHRITSMSLHEFGNKLGIVVSPETEIQILERNRSNRVVTVKVGEHYLNAMTLYQKLSLRSRDFNLHIEGDNIVFETFGYGHGVGMSQYGANGMAKEGFSYKQILTYYYQGTTVS